MDKWIALLKSRRFWVAVGGLVAIAFNDVLGIAEEDVNKIVAIVVSWLFVQTYRPTGQKP